MIVLCTSFATSDLYCQVDEVLIKFYDLVDKEQLHEARALYVQHESQLFESILLIPDARIRGMELFYALREKNDLLQLLTSLKGDPPSDEYLQGDLSLIRCLIRHIESDLEGGETYVRKALLYYPKKDAKRRKALCNIRLAFSLFYMGHKFTEREHLFIAAEKYYTESGLNRKGINCGIARGNHQINAGRYASGLFLLSNNISSAREKNWESQLPYGLRSLAETYLEMKKYNQALPIVKECLLIAKRSGDRTSEVFNHIQAAQCLVETYKDTTSALNHLDTALTIARAMDNDALEHQALYPIAELLIYNRKYAAAKNYLEELSDLEFEEASGLATLFSDYYWHKGDVETAFRYDQKALRILEENDDFTNQINALDRLGVFLIDQGRYDECIPYFRKSVQMLEEELGSYNFDPSFQRPRMKNQQQYNSLAGAFLELGEVDSAYRYAEAGKGRTALHRYAANYMADSQLVPSESRERLIRIEDSIAECNEMYWDGEMDDVELETVTGQLYTRKAGLQDHIYKTVPKLKAITNLPFVTIPELQAKHLSDNDLLISFSVGDDKISVFAFTKEVHRSFRVTKSIDSLSELCSSLYSSADTPGSILAPKYNVQLAHSMYTLLFSQLKDLLKQKSSLIIIPDRGLYSVPFEALVTNNSQCKSTYDTDNAKYLIESHDISYAVSIGLYVFDKDRPSPSSGHGLLAMGNPKLLDENIKHQRFYYASMRGDTSRGNYVFPPLLHATEEVERIDDIVKAASSLILTGAEASKRLFLETASAYKILHLAAHNLMDEDHPLQSALYLASDESNDDNGILTAREISMMKLSAELAVLSACNSGTGEFISSDGIISMGRAFWAAGVPSVVMSLWSVEDESTSGLMQSFYGYLKEGKSKSFALSQAKRDMLNTGERNPFYWAGFILQGNREAMEIENKSILMESAFYVIAGLLFFIVMVVIGKRASRRIS
jgi:CHAT domain-containing protein/tetratricopeptide (TPR) repeat protein